MVTLLIVSILLVALYVGATIWKRKELPESISAMVFDLPKGWQWVWGVWLWAVAFLTSIPAIEVLDKKGFGGIAFCMLVALVFVGAMPLFDTDNRKWHYTLAIIGGMLSQVAVLAISPWWLLLWLVYVAFLVYAAFAKSYPSWLVGRGVFFAECICYLAIVGALI